jgi:hypothetical protein
MRPAPVMLLLGSFANSALAAEAAEIHDPTFHLGYAYAKSSYPPVAGTLTRLTRWQEIAAPHVHQPEHAPGRTSTGSRLLHSFLGWPRSLPLRLAQ